MCRRFLCKFFVQPSLDEDLVGDATPLGDCLDSRKRFGAQIKIDVSGGPTGKDHRKFFAFALQQQVVLAEDSDLTAPHTLRPAWGEPLSLDPILTDNTSSMAVVQQLFSP